MDETFYDLDNKEGKTKLNLERLILKTNSKEIKTIEPKARVY